MAIAIRSAGAEAGHGSGSVTVPSVVAGDVLIAIAMSQNALGASSPSFNLQPPSYNPYLALIGWKVATTSGSNVNFNYSSDDGSTGVHFAVLAISGARTSSAVGDARTDTSLDAPSVMASAGDMLLCSWYAFNGQPSPPPSMTTVVTAFNNSRFIGVASETVPADGPTGTRSASDEGFSQFSISLAVQLKPEQTATPATVTAPPVTLTLTTPPGTVSAGTVSPASVTAQPVTVALSALAGTVTAGTSLPATLTGEPVTVGVTTPAGTVAAGSSIPVTLTGEPVTIHVEPLAGDVSAVSVTPASVAGEAVTVGVGTPAGTVAAGTSVPVSVVAGPVIIALSTPGGTVTALSITRLAELSLSGTATVRPDTLSGNATVRSLSGQATLRTLSGNVSTHPGLSGKAEVETLSGTATVRTLSGTAEVEPGLSGAAEVAG